MRKLIFFICIAFAGCAEKSQHDSVIQSVVSTSNLCPESGVCRVSFIRLLVLPQEFDDVEVRVTGYLVPEGSDTRLFFDQNAANNGLIDRSVRLVYQDNYPNTRRIFSGEPRYVSLIGKFSNRSGDSGGVHGPIFEEAGEIVPLYPPSSVVGRK